MSVTAGVLSIDRCSYSSNALFSSHVVSVEAEWHWSERLSGMGCKYKFLRVFYWS